MACERSDTLIHGYFDNELDALRAAELESHLEQCPECVAALDALQSLRSRISVAQPYEKMSASFRKKILADLNVKTATMMAAAPVIRRPLFSRPCATACVVSPVFRYSSWIRLIRSTS